jgi:hypothetical protein
MKAKRGLTQDTKPSQMDIEREVYRQAQKTEVAKNATEARATGGRVPPNPTLRVNKKRGSGKAAAPAAPAAVFGGRVPPRKAVEAAVRGMESDGFKIPDGHQVVMTFVPIMVAAEKPDPQGKKGAAGYNRPAGSNNKPARNQPGGNNRHGGGGNNNNTKRGRGGMK